MNFSKLGNEEIKKIAIDLGVPNEVQFKVFNQYYNLIRIVAEKGQHRRLMF